MISLVRLYVGVGTSAGASAGEAIVTVSQGGLATVRGTGARAGSGTFNLEVYGGTTDTAEDQLLQSSTGGATPTFALTTPAVPVPNPWYIRAASQSVATDIACLDRLGIFIQPMP